MNRKRILFVDDEPSILSSLKRLLREQEHVWEMVFVGCVDEALKVLSSSDYDVIVSDVSMPGKDGFALLREVRASERMESVPMVMITGQADDDLKALALNQGATDLLAKPVAREELLARIRSALRLKSYHDELHALNTNLEAAVAERTRELEGWRLDIIWRLAKACEYRDESTGSHVARVGCYSRLLAIKMGYPMSFAETVFLTAPLHDVGKIGIPDHILLKPGRLTADERAIMERHCVIGADILRREPLGQELLLRYAGREAHSEWTRKDNGLLSMAVSIALNHHERWDGSGYPARIAGEDIPIEGRIVQLADVYDALCFKRPYKKELPEEEAISIIRDGAGRQFDPQVFRAFESLIEEFRRIRTEVMEEAVANA